MKRYENNIGKVMPIRKFGIINNREVKYCKLMEITKCDTMMYFLNLFSEDMEKLGGRWVTGHMYRYHVLNKSYQEEL